MSKPKGDLSSLIIPKGAAEKTPTLTSISAREGTKSLTVKLSNTDYARLVRYTTLQLEQTGRRHTHQEVMVRALLELLTRDEKE